MPVVRSHLSAYSQSTLSSNPQPHEIDRPSYYAVLEAHIRYCPTISNGSKLLYSEITALCQKEGYCWATNRYFENLYRVSDRTIRRWLAELVKSEFIEIELEMGRGGSLRKIWICNNFQKSFKGGHKCPGGADTNVLHNNTKNNTKKKAAAEKAPPPTRPPSPPPKEIAAASLERIEKEERLTKQEKGHIIGDVVKYDVSFERLDHILTAVFDPSKNVDVPIALIRKALKDPTMTFRMSKKAQEEKKERDKIALIAANEEYARQVYRDVQRKYKGATPFSFRTGSILLPARKGSRFKNEFHLGFSEPEFKKHLDESIKERFDLSQKP